MNIDGELDEDVRQREPEEGAQPQPAVSAEVVGAVGPQQQQQANELSTEKEKQKEKDKENNNEDPEARKERLQKAVLTLSQGVEGEERMAALQEVRKQLSIVKGPPIQEVIDSGIVPLVLRLCSEGESKQKFEALWVITNICSGNTHQCRVVVELGAVNLIVRLLETEDDLHVIEQVSFQRDDPFLSLWSSNDRFSAFGVWATFLGTPPCTETCV